MLGMSNLPLHQEYKEYLKDYVSIALIAPLVIGGCVLALIWLAYSTIIGVLFLTLHIGTLGLGSPAINHITKWLYVRPFGNYYWAPEDWDVHLAWGTKPRWKF